MVVAHLTQWSLPSSQNWGSNQVICIPETTLLWTEMLVFSLDEFIQLCRYRGRSFSRKQQSLKGNSSFQIKTGEKTKKISRKWAILKVFIVLTMFYWIFYLLQNNYSNFFLTAPMRNWTSLNDVDNLCCLFTSYSQVWNGAFVKRESRPCNYKELDKEEPTTTKYHHHFYCCGCFKPVLN